MNHFVRNCLVALGLLLGIPVASAQVLQLNASRFINGSPIFPSGLSATFASGSTLTLQSGSTLSAQLSHVNALLDLLSTTRGSILYRGASGWASVAPDTAGKVWTSNGAGADPSWTTVSGVTSVGLSVPSVFSVTGSPVTGSGTLALSFASGQPANRFLATPDDVAGTLSLRAILEDDIPTLTWGKISKAGSTLADFTTRSAADLSSGTLPDARFPATLPAVSGANLTSLNADNLGSGTLPDARFPATLPAASGANLTSLSGTAITSGTVADARIDAAVARDAEVAAAYQPLDADLTDLADGSLTGSKVGTGINGDNVTTGTVADVRIAASLARDSEVAAAYQPLDTQLTDFSTLSYSGNANKVVKVNVTADGFVLEDEGGAGGGGDITAIHDNTSGEISAITAKATPAVADLLVIEDSAATNAKKSITIGSMESTLEGVIDLQDLQGAVVDAQIPSAIARDAEVAAAYQPLDADLTDLADGSLTGSKVGTGINGDNVTTGTVVDARIDAALARDSEVAAAYQPLDTQLTGVAALAYSTNAGKIVVVNGTENGFELVSVAGTAFANPTATIGLTTVNGSASTAMRSDGAPALSQAITPTWTGLHIFNPGTTQADTVTLGMAQPGSAGQRDGHYLTLQGAAFDTVGHTADWRTFVDVTSNAGVSTWTLQNRIDAGSFANKLQIADSGNATFAGTINGLTVSGGTVTGGTWHGTAIDLATYATGLLPVTLGGTGAADAAGARTNLGLVIGTNVQGLDADLTDLADGSLTGSKVGTGIDAGNITTGTLADARIDAALARDAEVAAAYQPLDTDLTYLAGFTPAVNVKSILNAVDYAAIKTLLALTIGTNVQAYDADLDYLATFTPTANVKSVLNAVDYAAIKTLLALTIGTNVQAYDADLDDLADGSLTGTKVAFADTDANFAAANVQAALEELDDTNVSGPNAADGKVSWTQLVGVPAGFADGSDDGSGGSSGTLNTIKEDGIQVGGSDIVTLDFLGADFDVTETPDTEINIVISAAIARDAEVAAAYQPLEATLTDIADGTIAENLINIANPWVDNEVADSITVTGSVGGGTLVATGFDGNLAATDDTVQEVAQKFDDFVLSGDVVTVAGVATIQANSVALSTDTTGNYAAGDAEAGAALTGDSATAFFSAGTLEDARLSATVTNTDVAETIAANWVNTANPWADNEVADAITVTGSVGGGTLTAAGFNGNLAVTDDTVQEVAQKFDDFVLTGDVTTVGAAATIAANSVALGIDTTGNYIATIADSGAAEITVANSGTENAAVTLAIAASIARDAEVAAAYQPLDTDLTYLAGFTPAANVKSILNALDYAAIKTLLALTIGTNVQAYDADLDDLADGSLTGSKVGTGISGTNVTTGTVPDAQIASTIARDSEVTSAVSAAVSDTAYNATTWDAVTTIAPSKNVMRDQLELLQPLDADLTYLATFTPTANVKSILNAADYAAIKTLLALTIGTNVQAYDADLTTWAGVTPGTGVAAALAVNVGSAGAPVVLNGALGTPSSGTVTNLTGTASININGTVGATTPAAGTFTTATATTLAGAGGGITLVATGFNGNLATTDDTIQEVAQKLDDFVLSGDVVTVAGAATIQANSVALGTDTTGNYVATIADSGASEITVANSGTETAAVTLAIAASIARDAEVAAAYQPLDTDLTYLAGFTPSANVKSVLNAADYAAIKTLLALTIGTNVQAYDADLTTYAGITPSANVQSVLGAADYAAIKTLLALTIGTNVQAYDADLDDLADGSLTGSKVGVTATPGNYTAATADVEAHLGGIDTELGIVASAASGASSDASNAVAAAAAALARANHTGTQASATITQSQAPWTGTPTITAAADVNGILFHATSAGSNVTVTLPASIAVGTHFWVEVADTSVGAYVFAAGAGATVNGSLTVWPGYGVSVAVTATDTWKVYQFASKIHVASNALADDAHEPSAPVLVGRVATATTAQWDAVYVASTGKYTLADSDASAAAADPVGIAIAGASADAAVTVLVSGYVRNDAWAFTAGNKLYVSASTPGLITDSLPNPAGLDLEIVGVAISADEALFDFSGHPAVRADSVVSLTNKTFDAAGTGNVLKAKGYIYLTHPHLADGTNAVINTTATAITYGHATFSNSVDQASNYVEYYIQVPEDLDTSVALRARLKFVLGGTDTSAHRHVLSSVSVADSAVPTASTLANAINLDLAGDGSGASGDVETTTWTTLTSWAGALTAGQTWRIRLARDGDDATNDASTVNSTELGLVLEYGITQ